MEKTGKEKFLEKWGSEGAQLLIEEAANWLDDRKGLGNNLRALAADIETMLLGRERFIG